MLSMSAEALSRAIQARGSKSALARELGIKPQAIDQWDKVPVQRVLAVESLTGISRHDLRPDIYGPAPASPISSSALPAVGSFV